MLELDLLLNNFVDKQVHDLDDEEHTVFNQLLGYPDQVLLDLLLGNSVSASSEIARLVNKIRATGFEPGD
jgi:succinate dehydrogenase flavin-adding protein (antitoxin of CptAB toxin-antitoxin module)